MRAVVVASDGSMSERALPHTAERIVDVSRNSIFHFPEDVGCYNLERRQRVSDTTPPVHGGMFPVVGRAD